MALNPNESSNSYNWNYSRPDDAGYSLSLVGTVVAIQEVQAQKFGANGLPTGEGVFWENNGQPKMNIRIVFAGESGGIRSWTFTPAGKDAKEGKKRSIHLDLFKIAGEKDMRDLIGKTLRISTEAPPAGFGYGRGNPRPWAAEEVTDVGPFEPKEELPAIFKLDKVYANQAVSGGTVAQPSQSESGAQDGSSATNPTPGAGAEEETPF